MQAAGQEGKHMHFDDLQAASFYLEARCRSVLRGTLRGRRRPAGVLLLVEQTS